MKMLERVPVLLVSDAQELDLLGVWLQSEGAHVHTSGWNEAAAYIVREPQSIVVLDLRMDEVRAAALIEKLRGEKLERMPRTIAMLPGLATSDIARALGCNKYLSHPMHPADLVTAIASLAASGPREQAPDARTHAREGLFQNVLEARAAKRDLRGLLRLLNATGPFRFTAILRFEDDEQLTSLWTFDRDDPDSDTFPSDATVSSSYCARVRDAHAPFVMPDSEADPSVAEHPARFSVRSYCGVPLVGEDGKFFGTLCQFDLVPRLVAETLVSKLTQAAETLRGHLGELSRSKSLTEVASRP